MRKTHPARMLFAIFNRHVAVVFLFFIILFLNVTHIARAQSMFFHLMGANALPPFVWTGNGGDTNWSTPGNWSSNVVPGISDVAIFMGPAACNVSCAATVDADISVLGINMQSTFTGTITQAAIKTISIGASGWTQSAGTFIGSNANITINNILTLSGGTFTSTSAQLLVTSGLNYTAGTFNHNNGLLRFDNNGIVAADSTINVTLPGAVQLWNLQYSGGYAASSATYTVNIASGSFDVQNQFQIGLTTGTATGAILATGSSINLKGNLIVDPSIAKVLNLSATNLILDGTGAQTYTATGGRVPNLVINKASGSVTPDVSTTSLVANTFSLSSGSFTAPPTTLTVLGDYAITSGTTYTYNNGSLSFDRYGGTTTSYTITLPTALTVNNLSFGGGVAASASVTSWTIAGVTPTINALGKLNIGNTQGGTGAIDVNGGAIYLTGNYNANAYSGSGTTTLTFNGAAAQSFTKTGAGSTMGGTITVDKSAGTMSLATAASFTTAGQDLSVTTGTLNMSGFNLTINDILTVGVLGKLICNGGVLSAASYVINGEISCGPSAGITWTGLAGNNLWNDAGNWTNNTIPGASDIAVFNGVCSGANCNVTMNVAVNVKGVKILSSFTGTVTQSAGITVTIGTSGWVQQGGTFAGGTSPIAMNGLFNLSAGSFTATSGSMVNNSTFTVSGAPTFIHNSGTLQFNVTATITPGTVDYYNVTFAGSNVTATLIGEMNVYGTLTLADTSNGIGDINTGTILAHGNVVFSSYGKSGTGIIKIVGAGNQTITGSSTAWIQTFEVVKPSGTVTYAGTLLFKKNYTFTSGTLNAGSSTVIFAAALTVVPGAGSYNNVTFAGSNDAITLTTDITVNGTMTLDDTSNGMGSLNTGTVLAYGNVVFSSYGKSGTSLIKLVGASNRTVTASVNAAIPNYEVSVNVGTIVTYVGTFRFRKNYTYTSGTIDAGTSTLTFTETAITIVPGPVSYYNVTFAGSNAAITLTSDITVMGTLTLDDNSSSLGSINTGTVLAYGNVVFSSWGKAGTSLIKIVGNSNQTITGTSSSGIPNLEIASTGGTVTFSGTLFLRKNYTYTSGTINASTSTLLFGITGSVITPGAVAYNNVTFSGGNATSTLINNFIVNGTLTFSDNNNSFGAVNSNSILASGNVVFVDKGKKGNAGLSFNGATSTTLSIASTAGVMSGAVTVAKTGGSAVTLQTDASFNVAGQNMTVSSGTMDMSGNNLTINSVLTVDAGGTLICNGGTLTNGSLVNNGVVDCASSPISWTGNGVNSDWNTAANWSGGVVPGVNDMALFSDANCGSNCNATVNINPNVKGVRMISDYTGTITQSSGVTMTIGSQGWYQQNGTFLGGDSAITFTGNITINGGTYRATSATSTTGYNFFINNSPVFNANNGTFEFTGVANGGVISSGSVQFYNVNLAGSSGAFSLNASTLTVNGTLTIGDSVSSAGGINNGAIVAKGDVIFNQQGYTGNVTVTYSGSTNTNLTIGVSAAVPTGASTINKSGELKALSNISLNSAGQVLNITLGTFNLNDNILTVNSTLSLTASSSLICGAGGSYTSGSLSNSGVIICGAYNFNWTGAGANSNWNTAANWSGGVAPGASDVAYFSNLYCGANCNATVNVNPNVRGVILASDYTGTITQSAGIAMTIGSTGWTQMSGTFAGGNSAITMNGPFVMSAGAFTATSGVMSLTSNYTLSGSAAFTHNSGTIQFSATAIVTPGTTSYNNLTFTGGCNATYTLSGSMTVNGTLTLSSGCGGDNVNTGTILASGNVVSSGSGVGGTGLIKIVGSGNQTITGASGAAFPNLEIASTGGTVTFSGTLDLRKNYTYTSGTVNAGTSTLLFRNSGTIIPGTAAYNNLTTTGCNATYTLIGTMTVNGTLTFSSGCGGDGINTGTILAYGNVVSSGSGASGTGLVKIVGSGNQTITGASGAAFPNLEIASTGGTVSFSGTLDIRKNYTYTSGAVSAGTSTLLFTYTSTIVPGTVAYNNLTFNGCNTTYTLSGTTTVNGLLTFSGGCGTNNVNTGTISANGNVVYSSSGAGGTAALNFVGTAASTLSIAGTSSRTTGAITVNKTGAGSLTLLSNVSFNAATQDLTITEGTLNMAGYSLTIGRNISNSGTLQRGVSGSCGALTYGGTYTGNVAICP